MNPDRIDILNGIIKRYNQFTWSDLHNDIVSVLGCSKYEASDLARSHCNMVSFWACMFASQKIDITYRDFFYLCLDTDIKTKDYTDKGCNKEGRLLVGKEYLCPAIFGFSFDPVFYESYNHVKNPAKLNPDRFYQLKITNTDHYMACYIENGILKLSDTNNRGIGIPIVKAKNAGEARFKWLLEI